MNTKKRIDRQKAISKLSDMIKKELDRPNINSEAQLGYLMGVSQGTINKLRAGKFSNIPDFETLDGISIYFGMSYSDFISVLEEECSSELTQKQTYQELLSAIYNINDIKILSEMSDIASSLTKIAIMRQLQ